MRTISVGKKTIAIIGTVVLAAVVFFATMIPSPPPAQAAILPLPTITVSVPILPPVTVRPPAIIKTVTSVVKDVTVVTKTQAVTLPAVTKVLPRATTTVTLPGAGVVQTVTEQAPVRTVTVNAPAVPQGVKTINTTQTVAPTTGQNGQTTVTLAPKTTTATSVTTAPGGQKVVTTTVTKEKPVVITRAQAVLSALGLAILGALIGMLILGAYRLGWFRGDAGNREFIEDTVDDLKYNK